MAVIPLDLKRVFCSRIWEQTPLNIVGCASVSKCFGLYSMKYMVFPTNCSWHIPLFMWKKVKHNYVCLDVFPNL